MLRFKGPRFIKVHGISSWDTNPIFVQQKHIFWKLPKFFVFVINFMSSFPANGASFQETERGLS